MQHWNGLDINSIVKITIVFDRAHWCLVRNLTFSGDVLLFDVLPPDV